MAGARRRSCGDGPGGFPATIELTTSPSSANGTITPAPDESASPITVIRYGTKLPVPGVNSTGAATQKAASPNDRLHARYLSTPEQPQLPPGLSARQLADDASRFARAGNFQFGRTKWQV